MAWLWPSFDVFTDAVEPKYVDHRGLFRAVMRMSAAQAEREIAEQIARMGEALDALRSMGLDKRGSSPCTLNSAQSRQALASVCMTIQHGEKLLLLDRRLAETDGGRDFLQEHDLPDHWERYDKEGRLVFEVPEFMNAAEALLRQLTLLVDGDAQFLVGTLRLSDELESDFVVARDLFSIGQQEFGLLACARGLERIVSHVAQRLPRQRRKDPKDASKERGPEEAAFYALVQRLDGVIWKSSGHPVIDKQTRALFDFVIRIRNACAHGREPNARTTDNAREKAILMSNTGQALWNALQQDRPVRRPVRARKERPTGGRAGSRGA